MFQISKSEPNYFTFAKAKVVLSKVKNAWSDENINNIRAKLRADILQNEQKSVCVYCEKEIPVDTFKSHIDHFKTRNLFPELTLNYENLVVSCNTYGRCANLKDSRAKVKDIYINLVNPIVENPEDFFDYLTTGEIIARNDKAEFTIDILGLNTKSLKESREQISKALVHLDLSLDEIYEIFPAYRSFINVIYPKLKGE